MRLGMLDVGSNTVHLLVVDARAGAPPQPAAKMRSDLRLIDLLDLDGRLTPDGTERLIAVIDESRRQAEHLEVEDLAAFATSALREAANATEVVAQVRAETGVDLQILGGEEEAKLTFLAARRWFGWSAGRLLVVDIGGGSLEVAAGCDELPEAVASLPLGASRLSRDWLAHEPPEPVELTQLRSALETAIQDGLGHPALRGAADHAVGTSKTLRSLARIAGASPYREGPYVRRVLELEQARRIGEEVSVMQPASLAKLPGVSASRASSLVAGAQVAVAAMEFLGITELLICPWALREGVILTRRDSLSQL
ncbi:MAG: Ppx/GppA family phosphatase [Mycobacteriales bacterium]